MTRMPITMLDRLGFSSRFYQTAAGDSIFPADEFEVRLITSVKRVPLATGAALQSIVAVSDFDAGQLLQAARFANDFGPERSQAIVGLYESMLMPAATLREEFGFDGDRRADVLPFIDKVTMKELVSGGGIKVPRFAPYSAEAARSLLAEYERIVVKPRAGSGARDVTFISSIDELTAAERQYAGRLADFEVEEHIDGPIYHVDSVVHGAEVIAASAARYLDPITSFRSLRTFRDIEIAPGEFYERLMLFNKSVISCYSNFSGVTHLEFFLTGGGPVFCEIAGRWGGGGIPTVFRRRTGIELIQAMLCAQLGRDMPVPTCKSDEICGWVSVYPPEKVMRRAPELSAPWIVGRFLRIGPGDVPAKPIAVEQETALIVVTGHDEAEVTERLRSAEAEVLDCFRA